MDFIIVFFRDILDGPVYTIVTVICSIFLCACIGYLAEKRQKEKQEKEQYVKVSSGPVMVPSSVPSTPPVATSSVPSPQVVATPTPTPASSFASSASSSAGSSSPIPEVQEIPQGPVQIAKPQVVAIPVSDTEASHLSKPQEVLPGNASQPAGLPSMQVAPTAPSVSASTGGTPVSDGMPTSVNQQ